VDIVILTSIGHRGDARHFKELGCSGYLLKPTKQQQLFDAILCILGQQDQEVEQPSTTRHPPYHLRTEVPGVAPAPGRDNPINRKLAVTLLRKAGVDIETVENGLQALQAVERKRYSLVLMDVQMPEMDGFEATQKIRLLEGSQRHTPIIAMTAHAMKGDRERCLGAGMDDYITKPLERRSFST
jgi:CheY-like chemotaxis protein